MHTPAPCSTLIVSTMLVALSLFAACKASPGAQAELDRIRGDRTAALDAAAQTREELVQAETRAAELAGDLAAADRDAAELATAAAREAELEADLADAQRGTAEERALWMSEVQALRDRVGVLSTEIAGGAESRAAWTTEAAVLAERIAGLIGQVSTLTSAAEALEREEGIVKSRDTGEQVSFWMTLLGTIAGGGAVGKILSKFGPSRGTAALDKVRAELQALQAAAAAFQNSPSRGATQAAVLAEKIAQLEGMLAAFSGGLQTPPTLPPPATPAGATG